MFTLPVSKPSNKKSTFPFGVISEFKPLGLLVHLIPRPSSSLSFRIFVHFWVPCTCAAGPPSSSGPIAPKGISVNNREGREEGNKTANSRALTSAWTLC
jgi:hypothetical protein